MGMHGGLTTEAAAVAGSSFYDETWSIRRSTLRHCTSLGRVYARAASFCLCLLGTALAQAQLKQVKQIEPAQAAASSATPAQPKTYDQWLDRAVEAFGAENFAQAYEAFEQAYKLRPNARVARGLGIAALRLGRYTEAEAALHSSLKDTRQSLTTEQSDEVARLMAWMQTSLGSLRVQWRRERPPGTELRVDERAAPDGRLLLYPGRHHVVVAAPGYSAQEHDVEIVAGSEYRLALSLTEAGAPSPGVSPAHAAQSIASPRAAEDMRAVSALPPATLGQTAPRPATSAVALGTERAGVDRTTGASSVFERWWFWTLVGAVAAGGVTTAVVLATAPHPKPYESNAIGPIFMPLRLAR